MPMEAWIYAGEGLRKRFMELLQKFTVLTELQVVVGR